MVLTIIPHLQVFGYIFSDEHDVVLLVSKVLPLVASFQVSGPLDLLERVLLRKPTGRSRTDLLVLAEVCLEDKVCMS